MNIRVTAKQTGLSGSSYLFTGLSMATAAYAFLVKETPMLWVGVTACFFSFSGLLHSRYKQILMLQIDDEGIYDVRLGMGKIWWRDLSEVQLQVTESSRFLCFSVRNPEPYIKRLHGANRDRVNFQRKIGFRGFNVDVAMVDVNLLDLKKQIDIRLARNNPAAATPSASSQS